MVIANCNSCNTLVSLDDYVGPKGGLIKASNSEEWSCSSETEYVKTELLLPVDEYDYDTDDDDCDWQAATTTVAQNVYLPTDEPVDMALKRMPQLVEASDQLLANPPVVFSSTSKSRFLYVAQGEVAHATSRQCDVMLSDKATTCHILALRSTSPDDCSVPLLSLTHVDSASYETCIRAMVQEHKAFHAVESGEEKKDDYATSYDNDCMIQMDIHILGGYEDDSARDISTFLMNLLGQISREEKDSIQMTLMTCAISSMNDDGNFCPIGRGLAVNMCTGEAFLAKLDDSMPGLHIRSARLWSRERRHRLAIIHSSLSNFLHVDAFDYRAFKEIDVLLGLPNKMLLQHTSTSPSVEVEDEFCALVRSTLQFIKRVPSSEAFVQSKPVLFHRVKGNEWALVQ